MVVAQGQDPPPVLSFASGPAEPEGSSPWAFTEEVGCPTRGVTSQGPQAPGPTLALAALLAGGPWAGSPALLVGPWAGSTGSPGRVPGPGAQQLCGEGPSVFQNV